MRSLKRCHHRLPARRAPRWTRGLPGERVELLDGQLWVDGALLPTAHDLTPGPLTIAPGTLGPERYALVGDNRRLPTDQSVHAVVGRDQLLGRVIASWRPGGPPTAFTSGPDPTGSWTLVRCKRL